MIALVASEFRKLRAGHTVVLLVLIGIGLSVLFTEGFAQAETSNLDAGMVDPGTATATIARSWFAMTLVSALQGAVIVTREYAGGSIARSILVAGTRTRLMGAKSIAATVTGLGMGVLAGGAAVLTTQLWMTRLGYEATWSADAVTTVIGVALGTTLSATWGVLVGWLVRHQVATVLLITGITFLIEPAIQSVLPEVSGYLFTIALTGVTLDDNPGVFTVGGSYLVLVAWVAVLTLATRWVVHVRDVA